MLQVRPWGICTVHICILYHDVSWETFLPSDTLEPSINIECYRYLLASPVEGGIGNVYPFLYLHSANMWTGMSMSPQVTSVLSSSPITKPFYCPHIHSVDVDRCLFTRFSYSGFLFRSLNDTFICILSKAKSITLLHTILHKVIDGLAELCCCVCISNEPHFN